MKKLFIPLVASLFIALASCNKPAAPAETKSAPVDSLGESNKALVAKFLASVFSNDTITFANCMAEDYMQHGPGIKDSVNKAQEIAVWKKNWKEQYASIKYNRAAVLAYSVTPEMNKLVAGDWVMEWGQIEMAFKNGMPTVKFNLHLTLRITNGKIDREYVYFNLADILAQQGFTFVPPKPTKK
jgi:hypothetical protein